jgi:hypothetical protein
MTDKQILELAEKHFSFITEYTASGWIADSEDIVKFAKAMYEKGRQDESELYVDGRMGGLY